MTMNRCRTAVAVLSLWLVAFPAFAQTGADRAAIRAAALDYIVRFRSNEVLKGEVESGRAFVRL